MPYVFFAWPASKHACPKRAACWSPAMPAMGISAPTPRPHRSDRPPAPRPPPRATSPPARPAAQQVGCPGAVVNVEHQRARGVGVIGHVHLPPVSRAMSQASIGPESDLARCGARPQTRHFIQHPFDLRTREIRIQKQPGPFAEDRLGPSALSVSHMPAERRHCQTMALWTGARVLAVPQHGGFPLVGDAQGRDAVGGSAAAASARPMTSSTVPQITSGSCSTQPGRG